MSPHGEIASPWGEDNIPAVVQTITAKQITEQVNASNAVETLRYLPSIEIVEKFPGDRFQDIQGRTTGPFQPAVFLVARGQTSRLGGTSIRPKPGQDDSRYVLTPFGPDRESHGYLIFNCSRKGGQEASIISDPPDPDEAIYSLVTSCFCVGYVSCDH
ncbi:TonB-dependent receptor plug domain-containing protein [Methylocystis rosea]|uniref:TonB-dependent receptor plug domain-containing protein n=1 Tax=Methylocystis rosea TaxID=173366 RepID=UPI00037E88D5|nr:TonB-dependent receptor plug domain-containing protein [Methylocystis rosea]